MRLQRSTYGLLVALWTAHSLAVPAIAAPAAPATKALTAPRTANAVAEAVALRRAGRFVEAAQHLLDHLAVRPDDARARHELAVLYALHGQIREAESQFRDALAADPSAVETQLALAELLRADERCRQALPLYQSLTQRDAGNGPAWKGQVLCQSQLGNWPAAIAAAEALVQRFPGITLGRWAAERLDQLRKDSQSGQLSPAQMDAEGKGLFAEKRYEAAVVWLAMALQAEATADRAYRLAMAHLGAQELLAAHTALSRAVALDPRHQPALMALPLVARALRNAGDGGERVAFGDFDQTPEKAIARALADNELVLARQLVQAALPKPAASNSAVLLVLAGELALRDSAAAKAQPLFEQALKLHPNHDAARKGLADALFQQGRNAEARKLAGLGLAPEYLAPDTDLQLWVAKRRGEFQHQLRMALDPGVRPNPSLVDQVDQDLPRAAEVLPVKPTVAAPAGKKGKGSAKSAKAKTEKPKAAKAKAGSKAKKSP